VGGQNFPCEIKLLRRNGRSGDLTGFCHFVAPKEMKDIGQFSPFAEFPSPGQCWLIQVSVQRTDANLGAPGHTPPSEMRPCIPHSVLSDESQPY
jgi:hypothetical protein